MLSIRAFKYDESVLDNSKSQDDPALPQVESPLLYSMDDMIKGISIEYSDRGELKGYVRYQLKFAKPLPENIKGLDLNKYQPYIWQKIEASDDKKPFTIKYSNLFHSKVNASLTGANIDIPKMAWVVEFVGENTDCSSISINTAKVKEELEQEYQNGKFTYNMIFVFNKRTSFSIGTLSGIWNFASGALRKFGVQNAPKFRTVSHQLNTDQKYQETQKHLNEIFSLEG